MDSTAPSPPAELQRLVQIAEAAGARIRACAEAGLIVSRKPDGSPVTNADTEADALIFSALQQDWPDLAILSEERAPPSHFTPAYWCFDPLDGTRSLTRGSGEYCVSIGRIVGHTPDLGVLYCPTDGVCYAGAAGKGAWKQEQGVWTQLQPAPPATPLRAVIAAREPQTMGARLQDLLTRCGAAATACMSSARKFGLLAEGGADIYPRLMRSYEWDTAAGQAILEALGGSVCTLEGARLTYGKPGFENGPFIARNPQTFRPVGLAINRFGGGRYGRPPSAGPYRPWCSAGWC